MTLPQLAAWLLLHTDRPHWMTTPEGWMHRGRGLHSLDESRAPLFSAPMFDRDSVYFRLNTLPIRNPRPSATNNDRPGRVFT